MTAGSFLGGKLADRNLMGTITGFIVALIGILALLPLAVQSAASAYVILFIWGLAVFSLAPPLQMRVMQKAADAPNAASTLNHAAFRPANAAGAWCGAPALTRCFDCLQLPSVAVGLIVAALFVAAVSVAIDRRRQMIELKDVALSA